MKVLLWILGVVAAIALALYLFVSSYVDELEVVQITDDLYMLKSNLGGNVGVLRTNDGTVIVDTLTFQSQGESIRAKAEEITGQPVTLIVNTHYHFDHTHGNPAFAAGTRVVATERTLGYLQTLDAEYWQGDAAGLLPNETFEHEHMLEVGGKTIKLLHPGRGHTDGDLVAWFEDEGVLHTGDLYFNKKYPNIDLEAGGSVREWVGTLDRLLAIPAQKIIPGHGELSNPAEMMQFQSMMRELSDLGAAAAASGKTLEQTLATAELKTDGGYASPIEIPFVDGLDRNFVVRRAWEEATGAVVKSP